MSEIDITGGDAETIKSLMKEISYFPEKDTYSVAGFVDSDSAIENIVQ